MGEEGSFLFIVILGWFATTFWCSFSERYLPQIRLRLANCHQILHRFLKRESLIWKVEKKQCDQAEKILEETYKSLRKALEKTRSDVALAVSEERALVLKIRSRTKFLTEFGHEPSAISSDKQLNNFQRILILKTADVELLRQRLMNLEDEIPLAYTRKQIYAARAAAELSHRRANYFLGNADDKPLDILLEEQLLRIEQLEARVLDDMDRASQFEIDKLDSQKSDEVLTNLDTAIRQLKQELSFLTHSEIQLKQLIETDRKKSETWNERGGMARQQGNPELAHQAFERGRPFLESAKLLTEQMPQYDESKFKVEKLLSKLEIIRERLEQNQ